MKNICVYCASARGNEPMFVDAAYTLGRLMAEKKLGLIYGGAKVGLMGAVANGLVDNGGHVTGVLPHFFHEKEIAHHNIDKLIMVNSMHERKVLMIESSDAFIALPGGFGTLDEISETLTLAQLGKHKKPFGFLNTGGFFDPLFDFFENMYKRELILDIHKSLYVVSDCPETLINKLIIYAPPPVKQWIKD